MSRIRLLLMALVALALSTVLTFYIYQQVSERLAPAIDKDEAFQIVVAADRLPLGMLIEAQHVRTAPWSRGVPLEGSFNQVEEVIGRGVVVPLLANEPILESKLAPRGAGAGLTTAIPAGMRAVSVRVNEVIGVAGFVLPGTRVDVIVTGSPEGRSDEISKIVLENVEVLAAGQNVERDARGTPQTVPVVTLLVTPADAQILALAAVDARIQLALRNPMDLEHTDPDPTRRAALYTRSSFQEPAPPQPAAPRPRVARPAPPPPPPPPPEPKKFEVELIQGGRRQTHTFEEPAPEQRPAPESPSQ